MSALCHEAVSLHLQCFWCELSWLGEEILTGDSTLEGKLKALCTCFTKLETLLLTVPANKELQWLMKCHLLVSLGQGVFYGSHSPELLFVRGSWALFRAGPCWAQLWSLAALGQVNQAKIWDSGWQVPVSYIFWLFPLLLLSLPH